jgi:hypothetical protein
LVPLAERLSVAVTVTLIALPATVGVPLMVPAGEIVIPLGNPVAENVRVPVPPVAVTVVAV